MGFAGGKSKWVGGASSRRQLATPCSLTVAGAAPALRGKYLFIKYFSRTGFPFNRGSKRNIGTLYRVRAALAYGKRAARTEQILPCDVRRDASRQTQVRVPHTGIKSLSLFAVSS